MTFHTDFQKNIIQKEINYDTVSQRPKNQNQITSKSGLFVIHFDTEGTHSVNLTDKDKNGIPDYVDSVSFYADYVYSKQITEMGFISPICDSLHGGTDAFDIYLFELGDGETNPDSSSSEGWGGIYGYTVGESVILPVKKFTRLTSYIVMDNDYSTTDSIRYPGSNPKQAYKTFGINGAKITLAHEFHHAVQFRYGIDDQYANGFSEMSSVMMETVLFPEFKDYMQYVRSLFKQPELFNFAIPSSDNGYRFCIFPMMIEQKYGMQVIRQIWEIMGGGSFTYKAIDSALILNNTSLDQVWMEFLDWIYFTNFRSVEENYFRDASEMPLFPFYTTNIYSEPSVSLSGSIKPYQIRFDQIIFKNEFPFSNDTLKLLTTHLNTESIIYGNYSEETYSQLICTQFQTNYERIFPNSPITYYYHLNSSFGHIHSKRIEIPGIETQAQSLSYPNPFRTGSDELLNFPAPEDAYLGEEVNLVIYNENMKEIYRNSLQVNVNEKNRVLSVKFTDINKQDLFSTGIYIFQVEKAGKVTLGKFALIKE
jgi:hypothetical protein